MSPNHQCYQKDPAMVARHIGGQYILVPIRDNVGDLGYVYNLNETGGYIWKLLEEKRSLKEIAALVAQQYEVDLDQAEADAQEFLGQMEAIGAIAPVKAGV